MLGIFGRMDERLCEIARTGNVEDLLRLTEDHPLLLHTILLEGGENPLHIACIAGHVGFVKKVIGLKKEFAMEQNQNGMTPLHIASAAGNIEIARELLKIDSNLCLVKGREQRIPLHCAAVKGRVEVVEELLGASGDSIAYITARNESALHLAVMNYQYEVLKVLVEHLKKFNKEDIVNQKDVQGSTVLHLAVSRRQFEVISLMLNEEFVNKSVLDINSLNNAGLTPLDVLLIFQSEAGDREIEEMLRRAGGARARDFSLQSLEADRTATSDVDQGRPQSPAKQLLDYFKYDTIKDSPARVRNTLLVIAVLIATATYQAVLSPPGGVWQDGSNDHVAGKSVMGSLNPIAYSLFLVSNSVGFFTSLHIIGLLTNAFPLQLELQISLVALIFTYDTCMTAIAPSSRISIMFTVISIVLPFLAPVLSNGLRNYLKAPRCELPLTSNSNSR
ncbi:PREDICTED: ankyrin repeat-containing protein At2g01680-like isoform X2 [Ipomoea nil]|uniref:ankyrin repeat-containing protein At2g01680-like isoform X2 n=1 Tax=Ipomoea nil TaxID=35883 RepID=UPI000901A115|nr:PREDICTED: ankyrin repeat-containing protein At2g01680-like isoform X2 [Ipomoea nil]